MPLSKNGRKLIEESGLKQRFLAAFADIGESQFSLIMSGKREPSLDQAQSLCECLGKKFGRKVEIDELFPHEPKVLPLPD
jgi:transcriptional regulator with XRE-family HTH domain